MQLLQRLKKNTVTSEHLGEFINSTLDKTYIHIPVGYLCLKKKSDESFLPSHTEILFRNYSATI